MKRGTFIIDGVESTDFNTYVQDRPLIETPMRKIKWKSAYGTDGDIPFDEGSYESTDLELILVINGKDLISDRQEFIKNMATTNVYKRFIPYFDPGKEYRIMLDDKIKFENKFFYGNVQAVSAKYKVKPYKYLLDSPKLISTSKTGSITNPTNYTSQPIIIIDGHGPVVLTVNGFDFKISEVEGQITLNSERYSAYHESELGVLTTMNNKIRTREYPVLKPGSNTFSIDGEVSRLEIQPRWRSLV